MKIEIEDYNIERFKKYLENEDDKAVDLDDLAYKLNKFLEMNIDLIF